MGTLKLTATSGGGSVSIAAPASSSNNRVITLPDITDGTLVTSQSTLDATKLSGNLPAIDGSSLTGLSGGITHARNYRMTSNFTHNGTHTILTNWEYADDAASGVIGSGWALPSSGIFSFPATGIYFLHVNYKIYSTGENGWPGVDIRVTQNNGGAYDEVANNYQSISDLSSSTGHSSGTISALVDCTDTGQTKFKLTAYADSGSGISDTVFAGDTSADNTAVKVIRLGDT